MHALPSSALAKPPKKVCPFPAWPNRCVWPGLEKSERSPGTGDLFTVDYAIWLHHEVEGIQTRIDAAVTATAAAYKEDLKYQATANEADRERDETIHKGEIAALKKQIPGFWERPATVMVLTALGTAFVVTVIYVGSGGAQRLRDEAAGLR